MSTIGIPFHRVFGGLRNRIMEQSTNPTPEPGMGATELLYSDRCAYTITSIHTNRAGKVVAFWAQRDTAIRTDKNGMSESQVYRFTSNPHDPETTKMITLRKDGSWVTEGRSLRRGPHWLVGVREEYRDPSF